MNLMQYILISSVCLTVFYLFYLLLFRNETNFRQLRFYLLISILLSILMPLNGFRLHILPEKHQQTLVIEKLKDPGSAYVIKQIDKPKVNWISVLKWFYLVVLWVLLGRILIQMTAMGLIYAKSKKERMGKCVLVYNTRFRNVFSFFNLIFLTEESSTKEDLHQIILHEKIHASQYHSLDIVLIELLAAVMWFNPLVWKMRNSLQLVHEYLADEGALSTGIDKLRYQTLLVNQVTEEKLICFSSSFNHSLIKKRMIMMNKRKFNHRTKVKIFTLIPVSVISLVVVACVNGFFPPVIQAEDNPGKVYGLVYSKDKLHPGVDTVKVAIRQIKGADTSHVQKVFIVNVDKKDSSKVTYILDGAEIDDISNVNPDSIQSVDVNKSKWSIVITSKKKGADNKNKGSYRTCDGSPTHIGYIVDSIEVSKKDIEKISPGDIEKVEVIKDKEMVKKRIAQDKDAVIIIKTKKKTE